MRYLKKTGIGMLVVISLLATFFLAQTSFAQSGKKEVKCSIKWTKIFAGSANSANMPSYLGDEGWELNATKTLAYSKLDNLINSGCNFQIVKGFGVGGGYITESYTCQYVSWKDGGIFKCLGGKYSLDGTEQVAGYPGITLRFGYDEPEGMGDYPFNGKLYYVPYGEEAFTNVDLKIYSRG